MHIRYVCISFFGLFQGPFFQKPKTLLQKILGDDMVLDVRFGEIGNKASLCSYHGVLRDRITVGWRRYRFFGELKEICPQKLKTRAVWLHFLLSVCLYCIVARTSFC